MTTSDFSTIQIPHNFTTTMNIIVNATCQTWKANRTATFFFQWYTSQTYEIYYVR